MHWTDLLDRRRVTPHEICRADVDTQFALVDRNLSDARASCVSLDNRFVIAYQAALLLAAIPVWASGYRTCGRDRHATTFLALEIAVGASIVDTVNALQTIRLQRHDLSYGAIDAVTADALDALLTLIEEELRPVVTSWLRDHRPDLASPTDPSNDR